MQQHWVKGLMGTPPPWMITGNYKRTRAFEFHLSFYSSFFFFWQYWDFELSLNLLDKYFTTWTTPSAIFYLVFFEIGSHIYAQAWPGMQSSYLHFLYSWDDKCLPWACSAHSLPPKPLHQPDAQLEMGAHELFVQAGLRTSILLISASQVARNIGEPLLPGSISCALMFCCPSAFCYGMMQQEGPHQTQASQLWISLTPERWEINAFSLSITQSV
jgi:hypothetical protein